MFTGIIEGVGLVRSVRRKGEAKEIEVQSDFDLDKTSVGESISVNGCCLTVTSRLGRRFWADVSPETLNVSTMGSLKEGDPVNIERSLRVGDRLSGHIVQGHVDAIGEVVEIKKLSGCLEFYFKVPATVSRYLVSKGSVAVDGVSLTVNSCEGDVVSVMVVGHTQLKSTFQGMRLGTKVNLEVDIIGKYVEKLSFLDSREYAAGSKITEEFLKKHGF